MALSLSKLVLKLSHSSPLPSAACSQQVSRLSLARVGGVSGWVWGMSSQIGVCARMSRRRVWALWGASGWVSGYPGGARAVISLCLTSYEWNWVKSHCITVKVNHITSGAVSCGSLMYQIVFNAWRCVSHPPQWWTYTCLLLTRLLTYICQSVRLCSVSLKDSHSVKVLLLVHLNNSVITQPWINGN